ncbi:aminotransferase class I/II-fold pyridoxal phosphate-dependent enzyme [Streptomyces sp. S.PNR 29]|uniref:aminotransferase class I/II-fold pyridoxal phosphate-dependent enzyme n=1 Tax=Streptomyces sp. S.PNR 29 TaxID=2973805 RepID=UPI0025B10870|nr:aminotransferase class I/II-fold pyridoxal phosphate-dependent enzyme [Streptomyces sp. S.PNR 29]MDN0198995.1 aminotransferase class I/II-fold pyridoxal phosphate-dependent enzyme [Streptomyces sp. S.PNR 29]
MTVDHNRAPVLEALEDYRRRGRLSFTPPGHKQARGADPAVRDVLGDAVFLGDVLASGGLDDRLTRGRVLQRAQELMADAVHADHTFFSTCGSSLSVKAAMLAVAGPHEKLLIGRDAHKSVVSGLILSGIEPVWVEPRWDTDRHIAHPPSAEEYARAFAAHPDAKGALVTSPTPYGACADLRAIAEVCHRRSVPLIVDEAWGAHLPFHPDLPSWAMDAGADICVTSIHKMGSGLEQGSVFHLQGDLVPPKLLGMRADLLGTTSPSVLIIAGLDGWRRQMALRGKDLMGATLELAHDVRAAVEEIDGLHVNDRADFCGPGLADDFDPLPGVIDISGLGITGFQAADWLREHRGVDAHLTDHRRIGAQITHGDDRETAGELIAALKDLVRAAPGLGSAPRVDVPSPSELRMEQAHLPRDAFFGPTEDVPVSRAAGRVAAEMITPYPPGIPAVLPGELLTEPVLRYLRTGLAAGMHLPDPSDPELDTIRVMARRAE